MPRDYKHRAQPRSAPKRAPSWVLILTGYLLGAMTVGLLWLKAPPRDNNGWIGVEPPAGQPVAAGSAPGDGGQPEPTSSKPRFDFYTMLPAMEVVIPEQELDESPPQVPTSASAAPPSGPSPRHLLQVGSFRKQPDAERMKARLALLGYSSHIQQAKGPRNAIWFRVRTTTFDDVAALRKARQQLEANGFRSLVIRASN